MSICVFERQKDRERETERQGDWERHRRGLGRGGETERDRWRETDTEWGTDRNGETERDGGRETQSGGETDGETERDTQRWRDWGRDIQGERRGGEMERQRKRQRWRERLLQADPLFTFWFELSVGRKWQSQNVAQIIQQSPSLSDKSAEILTLKKSRPALLYREKTECAPPTSGRRRRPRASLLAAALSSHLCCLLPIFGSPIHSGSRRQRGWILLQVAHLEKWAGVDTCADDWMVGWAAQKEVSLMSQMGISVIPMITMAY